MYTPVNPSFTISKWEVRASTLHGHVSMMVPLQTLLLLPPNLQAHELSKIVSCPMIFYAYLFKTRCYYSLFMFLTIPLHIYFDIFRYNTAIDNTLTLHQEKNSISIVCFRSNPMYVYNVCIMYIYIVHLLNKICLN